MSQDTLALTLPVYDQVYYDKLYTELRGYKVAIPTDLEPIGYSGIIEIEGKIVALMNRVNVIKIEADERCGNSKAVFDAAKASYEAQYDALITSRRQDDYESFKAVEAEVRQKLCEPRKLMEQARVRVGLLSAFRKSVESTYKNLENSKKALTDQTRNYARLHPPQVAYPQGQSYR